MKYIRTKDGIYDLDKSILYEFTGHKIKMPYYEEYEKQPELCKTTDTIEELCDEFVYVDEGCYPEISDELDLMQTKSTIIYGAIWTDKGLIYVAKMNNKGELELLWDF